MDPALLAPLDRSCLRARPGALPPAARPERPPRPRGLVGAQPARTRCPEPRPPRPPGALRAPPAPSTPCPEGRRSAARQPARGVVGETPRPEGDAVAPSGDRLAQPASTPPR